MTTRKYSSRSQQTTLSSAITNVSTTMLVGSASSLLGGVTVDAGTTFTVVLDPDTALEEIVDVTATSSNTLTITRGIDGSSAVGHSAGAVVRHMAVGRDYREANEHVENITTAHGLTIADVITTTNTKTLTNKTLTSPTITGTGAIAGTFTGNLTGNVTGNVSGTAGSTTGNAATATALATGRTFQLTGDVEASGVTFDGTGNVSLTTVIGTGAIVNADINASAAIDKTKISGTAITAADTGTVTSTMIANGAIVDADVNASAAIAKTKLNLGGTITSADLVDGTIVATDIADGTITAAKMVSDPYARANHTGSQTASTISDFDTQVRTNRLDQMAAPTGSVSVNSQKITSLATPTSNADAATKLYVDTKVADLVNSAPSTLDTLGEIATAIEAGGTVYESFVLKSGSTMTGALTLSGAPSSNLHAATKAYVDTVAGSATAAAASAAAAATTYDNFDDRYLGSKSTAPSVDNDGNALIEGALYWNSVDNAMYAWTGSEWGSISSTAEIYRFRFTAAGGETTISGLDDNGLTLSYLPGKEQVYLNGVLLVRTTDYTASNGSSLTSLAALAANDIVEVITFTSFEVADAIARTVFDAKGDLLVGTAADTVGKLTVGTNGQFLKADSSTATGLAWGAVAGALAQPTEPSSPSDGQIWIDTDGTAPTTVVTRWTEQPAAGTTVLTGNDDYSIPLAYSPGYEQVFLNGVLLSRSGSEYTATNGTSITLAAATVAGDIVEVICPLQIATTDTYTQSAVNNAFVANTNNLAAGKNAVINGTFDIWQRGTSFTAGSSYTADRWYLTGTVPAVTISRESSTVATGSLYSLKIAPTGGSGVVNMNQAIETLNAIRFAGQTVTLSVDAAATASTTISTQLWHSSSTDNAVGGSWTQITATSGGSGTVSTSTFSNISGVYSVPSTAKSLLVVIVSSGTAGQSAFLDNVQLELGATRSAFARAGGTIQGELAACQRYYQRLDAANNSAQMAIGPAWAFNANGADMVYKFPVEMRVAPTTLDYSSLSHFQWQGITTNSVPTSIVYDTNINSRYNAGVTFNKTSGYTSGGNYFILVNSSSAFIGFGAEL